MDHYDWNALKGEIERLYIKENKKLADVMQILETTRGFRKTRRQYERKLKSWKFLKYHMTSDKWKVVRSKVEKRRKYNRKSEVYINGIRCPSPKLRKELSRTFESTLQRAITAPSPTTPEGITICSPPPCLLLPAEPSIVPWRKFQQAFMAKRRQGAMIENTKTPATMPSQSVLPMDSLNRGILIDLLSWLTGSVTTSQTSTATRATANIPLLMPELADNQLLQPADPPIAKGRELHMHRYQIFLFLLSNKFIQLASPRQQGADRMVLQLLREAGIDTANKVKGLCSLNGIAADAIGEGFFGATVRCHDVTAMRLLLEAGVYPDTHIEGGLKALELAAAIADNRASLEITRLLLSYTPGIQRQEVLDSALLTADRERKTELCKMLLSAGAWTTAEAIARSVISHSLCSDPEMLPAFLNKCSDINETFISKYGTINLLGLAVELNNLAMVRMLLERNINANILQKVHFEGETCYTSLLGLAARKGFDVMVGFLLFAHLGINCPTAETPFISPTALAISSGMAGTVKLLARSGVYYNANEIVLGRSLIQRAAESRDWELCCTILEYSHEVDGAVITLFNIKLMYALQEQDFETSYILLALGASINDLHSQIPNTALGVAIETGRLDLIDLLLSSGAGAVGYDILTSIGNMEAAIYLENAGLLDGILLSSGQIILTTAIFAWNVDLVQYLLSYDVDRQRDETIQWQKTLFYRTTSRVSLLQRKFYHGLAKFISPLEAAISCGNYALATILLTRGAAVTEPVLNAAVWDALRTQSNCILREIIAKVPEGFHAPTAVAMAAYAGDCSLVRLLLVSGISPLGEPKLLRHATYETIFHSGLPEVVLSNGPGQECHPVRPGWWHDSPPLKGETVLLIPCSWGDRALLRPLLESAEWPRPDVGRALTISLYSGNTAIAQELINATCDVNQPLVIQATTFAPLCCAVKLQNSCLVQTLISHGADVNPITPSLQSTPIQRAVELKNIEIVRILMRAGADINAPPPNVPGATALQIAVKEGSMELIDILLNAGADIEANFGATALQFAALMGYVSIVYRLLSAGAYVNAPRAQFYGRTALEGAAEYGRIDMLQVLLNEGAHYTGEFRSAYVRAVKLAEYNGHFAAAKLLKQTGGWSAEDALQYESDVFDRDEEERFQREHPDASTCFTGRTMPGRHLNMVSPSNYRPHEAQSASCPNSHGVQESQEWWHFIDQLIDESAMLS